MADPFTGEVARLRFAYDACFTEAMGLAVKVGELTSEVSRLRDALAERDELIEAFQHTIEYIHTQSQGRTE